MSLVEWEKTEEKDEERLILKIPKDLKTQLAARAIKNRRSLNAEGVLLLERFVDSVEVYGPPLASVEIARTPVRNPCIIHFPSKEERVCRK